VGSHVPAIIIAFLAYSILDLGKAFQKVGLAVASRNRAREIGIWIAASLATSASSFLILYAVSLGSVLIVGAMAGTGLAAVIVLSRFLMKTPVGRNELLGVACVMAAPFLLATVYHEPRATRLVIEHLFYFLGAALTVFTILILFFRRGKKMLGILLAGGAGTLLWAGMPHSFTSVIPAPRFSTRARHPCFSVWHRCLPIPALWPGSRFTCKYPGPETSDQKESWGREPRAARR
jgi:hypothetical protein